MRFFVWLCFGSAALAGCASSAGDGAGLSTNSKFAQKIALIRDTKKNLKTASCKQIDEAMAYSYVLKRAMVDKDVVGKKNDKAKGASLIYGSYYNDFRKEHAGKCKTAPLKTVTARKLYPDIMRESKRRAQERKKLEAASAAQ